MPTPTFAFVRLQTLCLCGRRYNSKHENCHEMGSACILIWRFPDTIHNVSKWKLGRMYFYSSFLTELTSGTFCPFLTQLQVASWQCPFSMTKAVQSVYQKIKGKMGLTLVQVYEHNFIEANKGYIWFDDFYQYFFSCVITPMKLFKTNKSCFAHKQTNRYVGKPDCSVQIPFIFPIKHKPLTIWNLSTISVLPFTDQYLTVIRSNKDNTNANFGLTHDRQCVGESEIIWINYLKTSEHVLDHVGCYFHTICILSMYILFILSLDWT